ncbi:MAG: PAS domain S-box protein, partial [Chromatiaceae bacterium]|nr:PAS domain S-box protein [Chromatiaceae bacterium]
MGIVADIDGEAAGRQDVDRFFSLSLQLLLIADKNGRIRRCNPAWREQLGWSPEALIGRSFLELVHPDDLLATQAETTKLSAGGATSQFVNRYRRGDGEWRSLAWSAVAAPDTGRIYAIAHDVTLQEQATQALRANEQRLHDAERLGGLGSWELDLKTEQLFWSDQIYRLLGHEPGKIEPSYHSFLD